MIGEKTKVFRGDLYSDPDDRSPSVKILHVFGRMNRGGAEMRTLELMKMVQPLGLQFHFYVLSGQQGELDDRIYQLGGLVHYQRLNIMFPVRFKRILSRHKFDVVHSHVYYFSGYVSKLAAEAKIPVRIAHFRSVRDYHGERLHRKLYRRLMKHWIDRYATHILAVSKSAMDASWGEDWRSDRRCRVIYNGLDTASFTGSRNKSGVLSELALPLDCHLIAHVGRMSRPKNHERVISIFSKIHSLEPKSRLLLIGRSDNDIEVRLRKRVNQLGLASRVVFLGERMDVPRLLKAADLMILPSLWEGLPGVCLEACAAGTPVLASDLPGVREIADHLQDIHYLGLEEDDSVWASLAKRLLGEHQVRRSTDAAVREFSKSVFSLENCMRAHLEVWKANSK
ncbi:MAG: glycosyltransferase [Deltaproteobacteria bacterium]|nr:glycosyltransferase [Deltaproteobacteria bacterium]